MQTLLTFSACSITKATIDTGSLADYQSVAMYNLSGRGLYNIIDRLDLVKDAHHSNLIGLTIRSMLAARSLTTRVLNIAICFIANVLLNEDTVTSAMLKELHLEVVDLMS